MPIITSLFAAAFDILSLVLGLYVWILIISAVLSWLIAFDIVNRRSRFIQMLGDIMVRLTEPLLRPIRRYLPPMGGVDLSPLILIFGIMFLQSFLRHLGASL